LPTLIEEDFEYASALRIRNPGPSERDADYSHDLMLDDKLPAFEISALRSNDRLDLLIGFVERKTSLGP
jgi:hypothetical protein